MNKLIKNRFSTNQIELSKLHQRLTLREQMETEAQAPQSTTPSLRTLLSQPADLNNQIEYQSDLLFPLLNKQH